MRHRLPPKFFTGPTLEIARGLLGMRLSTNLGGKITSGIIVEVEAYGGPDDRASHAWIGITKRNEAMFREGGHCYVYLIYGMHYCVNVVTEQKRTGAAVLIRALEPEHGLATMMRRRKTKAVHNLCSGPAKLCQALRIDKRLNALDLRSSSTIWIEKGRRVSVKQIQRSKRLGISKSTSLPWRFSLKDNPWVS